MLIGSLAWEEKRKSLEQLLGALRSEPALDDVTITVTGGGFRAPELEAAFPSVEFHAYVDDLQQLMHDSRLGIIYEPVGGGFKMKTLNYVFSGVPLMIFDGSAVGLGPVDQRSWHLRASNLNELVRKVVGVIDDPERLNELRQASIEQCDRVFGENALRDFRDAFSEVFEGSTRSL